MYAHNLLHGAASGAVAGIDTASAISAGRAVRNEPPHMAKLMHGDEPISLSSQVWSQFGRCEAVGGGDARLARSTETKDEVQPLTAGVGSEIERGEDDHAFIGYASSRFVGIKDARSVELIICKTGCYARPEYVNGEDVIRFADDIGEVDTTIEGAQVIPGAAKASVDEQ